MRERGDIRGGPMTPLASQAALQQTEDKARKERQRRAETQARKEKQKRKASSAARKANRKKK